MKFYIVLFTIVFVNACSYSQKKISKNNNLNYCIESICFDKDLVLIDSLLDESNYQGISMKVYDLDSSIIQKNNFDSLLNKGYSRLPFQKYASLPFKIMKYLYINDNGFYQTYPKKEYGEKYVILNLTRRKLIIYEYGILEDLIKKDSILLNDRKN